MAELSKPSDINKIWADGGDVVSPSDVKIGLGWEVEVPPRQFFNWLDNKQDQFNAHVNQHGIPVWDSVTEYQAGKSYAQGSNGIIYVATQTHTNQNPVSTPSHWEPLFSHGMIKFDTAGVTAWTVPLAMQFGLVKPKVTVVGAGGGSARNNAGASGAGAGGGSSSAVLDLTGVVTIAVTIGSGGLPRTGIQGVGGNGGTSSFAAYLSATGGAGGTVTPGRVAGGIGIGGTVNIKGSTSTGGSPADAGDSIYGGRGAGASSAGLQGDTGQCPGAGGGGSASGIDGVAGADGIVVVEW